jgi:hypothetical protein
LIPGRKRGKDVVYESRLAYDSLRKRVVDELFYGMVYLEIVNRPEEGK